MIVEAIVSYSVSVHVEIPEWEALTDEEKHARILDEADHTAQNHGFGRPLIISCSDDRIED